MARPGDGVVGVQTSARITPTPPAKPPRILTNFAGNIPLNLNEGWAVACNDLLGRIFSCLLIIKQQATLLHFHYLGARIIHLALEIREKLETEKVKLVIAELNKRLSLRLFT